MSVAQAASPWEVLRDLCRALSSAASIDEVVASTGEWVRGALGTDDAMAQLRLPDAAGRLRVAWAEPDGADGLSGTRSTDRQGAFRRGSPVVLDLGDSGRVAALVPLMRHGTPVGLLEVAAPRSAVEQRWETLEAVADQVAVAVWNSSEQARLRREAETLEGAARLSRLLVGARSPRAALRVAVRFVGERFRVPVAAWLTDEGSGGMDLIGARGLPRRSAQQLRREMGTIPRWRSMRRAERAAIVREFTDLAGIEDVRVVNTSEALVLSAQVEPSEAEALDVVRTLLEEVLRHVSATVRAERRDEHLDLGIAWTAHEFRGPLLAVRAALEILMREEESSRNRIMLQRSVHELEQLASLVDGLLGSVVRGEPIRRQRRDVVYIVREAVALSALEVGEPDRVRIEAPRRVPADIDPVQLRGAVSNLVRNALKYSEPGTPVGVAVEAEDSWVAISVSDEGPGIGESERESIFRPFVRGAAAAGQNGAGLGLFIARSIAEAHDGRLAFRTGRRGTTFRLEFPEAAQAS